MKTSDDILSIDTNVIIRYLTQDDEVLSAKADAVMEAMDEGRIAVYCDPVILAEVVWVLKSMYKLTPARIAEGLGPILKSDGFIMPDKSRYLVALELYTGSRAHFADACACAAALECADGRLLSFDRDLSRIPGIHRLEKPISK